MERVSEPDAGGSCVEVVVSLDDAIVEVRYLRDEQSFTVGGEGTDFPLAEHSPRALVTWNGIAHAIAAELVELGPLRFLVRFAEVPQKAKWPFRPEPGAAPHSAVTALTMLSLIGVAYAIPPDPKLLSVDSILRQDRILAVTLKPPEEPPGRGFGPEGAGSIAASKAAKGPSGKLGKVDGPKALRRVAIAGQTRLQLAKQYAMRDAAHAGILGLMHGREGSHVAAIWVHSASALGPDAENVMGGLLGTQIGESDGVPYGLGPRGPGDGGGGDGETIGFRGTCGTIDCTGRGNGKGPGGGGFPRGPALGPDKRRPTAPEAFVGDAKVVGTLDKDIIRRVVRKHLNEVRFCYEKQLVMNRGLEGRVQVQFVIAGTGNVLSSALLSSSVGSPAVGQCIAQAVARWEFPRPENGGTVMVTYPFVLRAPGT